MKRLLCCADILEAHHYANLLNAAGIEAEVRNTFLVGAMGEIPLPETSPQVWIGDAASEAVAREIIASARQTVTLPSWLCQDCGELMEGQFTHCWRCGRQRGD